MSSVTVAGSKSIRLRHLLVADQACYRTLMLKGVTEHPDRFRLTPADVTAEPPPFGTTPDGFTLGAWMGEALAGVVSVAREAREKLRHKALLFRMYVDGAHAGAGIGGILVERAIADARGLSGIRHLNLTVLSGNVRAHALYQRYGFRTFSIEPDAVYADGAFREEQTMKLILQVD